MRHPSEDDVWGQMRRAPSEPDEEYPHDDDPGEGDLDEDDLDEADLDEADLDKDVADTNEQVARDLEEAEDPELTELRLDGELRLISNRLARKEALETRRENAARRALEPPHPDAARAWFSSKRMTRTEVSLRLALHLIAKRCVASDITVALTGHEMTSTARRPGFPVAEFLARHDCGRAGAPADEWRGRYVLAGAPQVLILCEKADEAPMIAQLHTGARLLVDVMGGPLDPTRSSGEHTHLRTAIGRAITLDNVGKRDLLAVAMPRSKRFRLLTTQWGDTPRVLRAGLRFVLVDRAGNVSGLRGLRKSSGEGAG